MLNPVAPNHCVRLFDKVLCLGFSDHLPLHVARGVEATAFQRDDVIDDITGAGAGGLSGRWAGLQALELAPRRRRACARYGSATLSVCLVAWFAAGRGTTLGGGYHAGE